MAEAYLRHEEPKDCEAIRNIVYAAFLNHPQHLPGSLPTEHKIVDCLRESGALALSIVYVDNGEIVGHVAFSPVLINGEMLGWYGIGPIAVRPDRQGQGIGSSLMNEGIRQIKEIGASGIVLVGDPNYYCRFGFKSVPELTLDGVPAKYFMGLSISGAIPPGAVTFHDAFNVS